MKPILTVSRQLPGFDPVLSYLVALPPPKDDERFIVLNGQALHEQMVYYKNQATELAREHVRAFSERFPEFSTPNCKWCAYLVDEDNQTPELGCAPIPLPF